MSTGSSDLFGKVWASDKMAIRLEFGFVNISNGPSETDFTFGGGVEYHWTDSKVSPFVGGGLMFESSESAGDIRISSSLSNGADVTVFQTTQSTIRLAYYF